MEHQSMIELMQRALDEGLEAAARDSLDAHLQTCTWCAMEWEGLQAAHRQLAAAPQVMAAAGFTARVLERIAAEQRTLAARGLALQGPPPLAVEARRERPRALAAWPLLAAAALLGALTLGLLLAPLAGLVSFDLWTGSLSDSLALLAATIAWLTLLLTFVQVVLDAVGDGLLAAALVAGLVVTFIWIRLVGGAGLFRRPAYMNGGVS